MICSKMNKFKASLLVIGVSLACAVMVRASDFDDGWKCGWEAGWKQVKGHYSFAPYAPYAPYRLWVVTHTGTVLPQVC
jgi:hypothetical protein